MPRKPRFRIYDLLAGRTLIESDHGRDLVAYHREHYRPGLCDWWWQHLSPDPRLGWQTIPRRVLHVWQEKYDAVGTAAPPP